MAKITSVTVEDIKKSMRKMVEEAFCQEKSTFFWLVYDPERDIVDEACSHYVWRRLPALSASFVGCRYSIGDDFSEKDPSIWYEKHIKNVEKCAKMIEKESSPTDILREVESIAREYKEKGADFQPRIIIAG